MVSVVKSELIIIITGFIEEIYSDDFSYGDINATSNCWIYNLI